MKKIKWVVLSLILCIPFNVFAYDDVYSGVPYKSGTEDMLYVRDDYYDIVGGYLFDSTVNINHNEMLISIYDYDVNYYTYNKDKDGNVVYNLYSKDQYKFFNFNYNDISSENLIHFPYLKDENNNDVSTYWFFKNADGDLTGKYSYWIYSGYNYVSGINAGDDVDTYSKMNLNFYQAVMNPNITCEQNADDKNLYNCSVFFDVNFNISSLDFNLSSTKFNVQNIKFNSDFWKFDEKDDELIFKFDLFGFYDEDADDEYNISSYMMDNYNIDIDDYDSFTEFSQDYGIKDGQIVMTFDVATDGSDITDSIKLSDLEYTVNYQGSYTGDDVNISLLSSSSNDDDSNKQEETVVENPKTGITTFSYLLIPVLIGFIILIKNRKNITLFKNR